MVIMIKLSLRQKQILFGTILGDAYLQATGKKNARLRLEHSDKQKDYIFWKYRELKNLFSAKPKQIERYNPIFKRKYIYFRCQSNSTPYLGKLKKMFYGNGKKIIPENIDQLLNSPLTLAIWYMDDGYYYGRDKVSYLYLPEYRARDIVNIQMILKNRFSLVTCCHLKKKKKGFCLYFPVKETSKLIEIVEPHIIKSMRYKIPLNPVSTERNPA